MLTRLRNLIPSRRRYLRELADAEAQMESTAQREEQVERAVRDAEVVATRLARHRQENHFAQRMRAAYGRQEGRA